MGERNTAGKVLITGGAGFIGCNAADRLAAGGWQVLVLDDLSRPGSELNLRWLRERHPIAFERTDVRNAREVTDVLRRFAPDAVLHLAGQVAVTCSVADPRRDFEVNALGTFNVLEAVRQHAPECVVVNASTNKVYGAIAGHAVEQSGGRYRFRDLAAGVDERTPLEFLSPYGCSKGAADQYVMDYGRIYGLRTVTLRQSCIYGPRQFGLEDQGWLAWFVIAAEMGLPVTVYGDGCQVRDVLHVHDLVDLYERILERGDAVAGQALNVGGGPANTLSLLELLAVLEQIRGRPVERRFGPARPGDQAIYVSDIGRARALLGWEPATRIGAGVRELVNWVRDHRGLFSHWRNTFGARSGS